MGLLLLMGDSGFNVRSELFSTGEQGLWLDPSDFSTMWQDSGQLTPVTAVGQPVGYIADKSGRGNHCVQATSGARPTLQVEPTGQYYLSFDGTDDSLATAASVNFSATDEMTVIAGVRKLSDAVAFPMILEVSESWQTVTGSVVLCARGASANTYYFGSRGNGSAISEISTFASPITNVITLNADVSADLLITRVNGAQTSSETTDQGTGNYGNHVVYIGRRANTSLPFNGRLYQLIMRGRTTPTSTLARAERFVGTKTGVTF